MGRWFWDNVGTLILAFLLAVVVWVVAVNEENPTEERAFAEPVVVELINTPPDLIRVGAVLTETTLTIRAPRLTWEALTAEQIHLTADLAGQTPGTYDIPVSWRLDQPSARVIKLAPASIHITLESRATRELPLTLEQAGEPAQGYEAGATKASATVASLTGPSSAVDRVSQIVVALSIANRKQDFNEDVILLPVDASGKAVTGVTVTPQTTRVIVPITQKAGFRDVAVKVVTQGQVAAGYRITNITVAPPVITVSSNDPLKVGDLPGFVETQPLDLNNASDDIAQRLALALPEGVRPESEQSVLVQVNIAAIEGSLTVPRQLTMQGLEPGLTATSSPETVDVLLLGPLPVLDTLKPEDVIVFLDLKGLGPGTYQIAPQVNLLPDKLRAEIISIAQVEVVIKSGGTPTPEITGTPRAKPTPTATKKP